MSVRARRDRSLATAVTGVAPAVAPVVAPVARSTPRANHQVSARPMRMGLPPTPSVNAVNTAIADMHAQGMLAHNLEQAVIGCPPHVMRQQQQQQQQQQQARTPRNEELLLADLERTSRDLDRRLQRMQLKEEEVG